ncbi:MAG: DUF72 domain-containing protein [Thermoanaerobaculia bacterium]
MIRAGTSGFSYKEWKGGFYPEKLKNAEMLEYYASQLPAVEINNTFYRMPRAEVLEGWARKVPTEFRFILKASRRITHFKRLKDTEEITEYVVSNARILGDRLGALLFQLPPNFKQDLERLERFLEIVPDDVRAAFEFRHGSWFDDETYGILKAHNRALCLADTDDSRPDIVSTADWGYLRLRRVAYSAKSLGSWLETIRDQGWDDCFVFFKHEDEAGGPRMAAKLLSLV